MKSGIRWHDGARFDAGDICFTIDALTDPRNPVRDGEAFRDAFEGCDVLDYGARARIRFRRPVHNPKDHLSVYVMPEHLFEDTQVPVDHDFAYRPVGTGPMKGWRTRNAVRFQAYPNVHHNARIQSAVVGASPDPYLSVMSLQRGDVQGMVSVPPPLRPEVAAHDEIALKSYDLRSWWFIAVNTNHAPLRDKGIRKQIEGLLDRERLRALTVGVDPDDPNPPVEFVSGPFVQSSPYYNRKVPVRTGASELGYTGPLFSVRLGVLAPLEREAIDIGNQVAAQLRRGELDVTVERIRAEQWPHDVDGYDLVIGKWSWGLHEDVGPLFHTMGERNLFHWSHPDADRLIEQYRAARTDTEAQEAFHQLHALLADELPYFFLWKADTKSAWRNEVRNNTISPYWYFTEFDGWKTE